MARYYWYTECPFCGQGRLTITKDATHESLYLHCDECEWGWRNPDSVVDPTAKFLTLDEDFVSENPTFSEIEQHGWAKYAMNVYDE